MKRNLSPLLSAAFLLVLPAVSIAGEYSIDSATILRLERRDITGADKETLLPTTQFLGMDMNKLADGNLSLHLYGWGRADFADRSYNSSKTDGSLTYGYLQYRFNEAADVRVGRFFVHEGIANEQVDGISAHSELPMGFGLSLFGGATVHTNHLYGESSDGKGDVLYGGRANYHYKGMLELGVSGVYEGKAPTLVNYSNGNHRLLGGDVWLSPHKMIEIIGHSSYNPESSRFAEQSYLLNIKPISGLVVTGEYTEQNDRSYQYAWAMFSGAKLNSAYKSSNIGMNASYQISRAVELALDYKHYSREIGKADRYGGNTKFSFLNNALRSGIGYHYLRAGSGFAISTTPSASYHELRGYALHDTNTYFTSVDVIGFIFKDKVYNEKSAWEAIASLGYHITPTLALSGDINYGRNPQFTEETRGLIRLTYNMISDGKGGEK